MDAIGDDHGQNPIAKKGQKSGQNGRHFRFDFGGVSHLPKFTQTSTR
jgi:hypothetical protein